MELLTAPSAMVHRGRYAHHFQIQKEKRAVHIQKPSADETSDPPSNSSATDASIANAASEPQKRPTPLSSSESITVPAASSLPRPSRASRASPAAPNAIESDFDVYAKPFVPDALRAINIEQPSQIIVTDTRHKVDTWAYVDDFAGKAFVPARPLPSPHGAPDTPGDLSLNEHTYLTYFHRIFSTEIAAQHLENESYALYKAPVSRAGNTDLYALYIPGLREDSPQIGLGDVLQLRQLLTDPWGNLRPVTVADPRLPMLEMWTFWGRVQYNASVYGINRARELVFLKIEGLGPGSNHFNVVFPIKESAIQAKWDALAFVAAEVHRVCLLIDPMHQEAQSDSSNTVANTWVRKMLFPTKTDGTQQTELPEIARERGLFDSKVNYEQLKAIDNICRYEYGVIPFLVSGPPGTGKTKTLVETAMQLLNTTSTAHILICAPSDPAADTLALRLSKHLTPQQLLRLNGPGRTTDEVPGRLMAYTYVERDIFYLPPMPQLMRYNVVVTSCRDAAILFDARLTNSDLFCIEKNVLAAFRPEESTSSPKLHWGALLMDEAAQATELDALLPLTVLMPPAEYPETSPQPQFVLAGDQNQLGPRTASRGPITNSLFARLFARPLYAEHPLSRSKLKPSAAPPMLTSKMLPMTYPPFVNLVRNYRSHPAILTVPSSLFYADTLIPEASLPNTHLQRSSVWQGRKWPVLFICESGLDEIETDGGGWYNPSECKRACDLAQKLWAEDGVAQQDICIMSPFAAQVKRLRGMIRGSSYGDGSGLWDVNIGPLEAFQGLESRVVIICTTRTRKRFLEQDQRRGLGLIEQPKRMNVALTRAMEGLFVIGNPQLLVEDEHWSDFLAFCWRNDLVLGEKPDIFAGSENRRRVGILEKALIHKEEAKKLGLRPALGSGAAIALDSTDDDMWTAGLVMALDEIDEEEHDEEHDGVEYDDDCHDEQQDEYREDA